MAVNGINPAAAAGAYASSNNIGQGSGVDGKDENSFLGLVKKGLEDSVEKIRSAEKMSARAVTGKAELADVVQAVNEAEIVMETVITLRDRMIGAYQQIMRMPI